MFHWKRLIEMAVHSNFSTSTQRLLNFHLTGLTHLCLMDSSTLQVVLILLEDETPFQKGLICRRVNRLLANCNKLSVQAWYFSTDGSEYPETSLKLSFGTTELAAYANKFFVCLFVTKNREVFTGLILYSRTLIKLTLVLLNKFRWSAQF